MIDHIAVLAGVLAIGGGVIALGSKQLMRGILSLSLTFLSISILCWQLGAQYLAVAQALVFLGGVVALLILAFSNAPAPTQRGGIIAGSAVAIAFVAAILAALPRQAGAVTPVSASDLSIAFLSTHAWALHAALLLLLAGIIAAQYLAEESQ